MLIEKQTPTSRRIVRLQYYGLKAFQIRIRQHRCRKVFLSTLDKLLAGAIIYAKSLIDITEEEYSIIMSSSEILLF